MKNRPSTQTMRVLGMNLVHPPNAAVDAPVDFFFDTGKRSSQNTYGEKACSAHKLLGAAPVSTRCGNLGLTLPPLMESALVISGITGLVCLKSPV
ncbi:hypothetical protein E8K88_06715 [Lampropedia aestuarii]|uniref:Uncharacterized protein n=1 Tax=Lampropedia aestuarii TaxID=2562762 RepID=A0A4S5BWA1_9BURK|nr:hypothetical protein [Lampropedia aestuarii]THJ34216.1 hypothetical protein E8K88_06715 [Lampropedia aestuarii]